MIKHINNLLENNNVLMGNIVRCFKDGSSSLCTWLSTLEGFPGSSVQFSHSSCPTFCNPMNHTACQASLSVTNSQSLPKPMSIQSTMPSNHLILCCPLLLLALNLSQHQGLMHSSKSSIIYIYIYNNHFAIQQKLTQHCKSTIL